MRDLELVGPSEDGSHVLLVTVSGEDFRVLLDTRLRAAVDAPAAGGRSPDRRPRPAQVETSMDTAQQPALRPRDIQARIRAGESPEAVAAVAQLPVERVMAYAVPVLAEREHVCAQARRCGLRRKHASGPSRQLGQAVDEHLRSNGWDPAAATWDSWRREDGRWSVTVAASRSGEPATFLFDLPGRYAFAHDDAARRLVGDEPPLSVEPDSDEPRSVPRLETVRPGVPDDGTPVEEGPAEDAPVGPRPRVSALDRLRRQRAHTGEPLPFDADPVAEIRLRPADRPEGVGDTGPAETALVDDVEAIARVLSTPAQGRRVAVGESEPGTGGSGQGASRRRKPNRRAVPSWDEIMFGSKPPG